MLEQVKQMTAFGGLANYFSYVEKQSPKDEFHHAMLLLWHCLWISVTVYLFLSPLYCSCPLWQNLRPATEADSSTKLVFTPCNFIYLNATFSVDSMLLPRLAEHKPIFFSEIIVQWDNLITPPISPAVSLHGAVIILAVISKLSHSPDLSFPVQGGAMVQKFAVALSCACWESAIISSGEGTFAKD